ncbi:hypothetical protein pb186bvf_013384 [Paramecium bursaria]
MQEVKIDLPDIDVKELLIIQRQKIFIVIQLLLVLGTFQLQEYSFHDNIFFMIGSILTISLLLVLHKQQVTKQKFHRTIETAIFLSQILIIMPTYSAYQNLQLLSLTSGDIDQ